MTTWIIRLHHHDERALHAMVLRRHPRLDRAMHAITRLGDAAVTIGVTLALLLGAVPALRGAGMRAAFALVASHAVVQLLKRTVTRARPRMPEGSAARRPRSPSRWRWRRCCRRPPPPRSWRWRWSWACRAATWASTTPAT